MRNSPRYSVLVPVFNEEAVVTECHRRRKEVMDSMREPYELTFIDDGSRDGSGDQMRALAASDPNVRFIGCSRNFGHQDRHRRRRGRHSPPCASSTRRRTPSGSSCTRSGRGADSTR